MDSYVNKNGPYIHTRSRDKCLRPKVIREAAFSLQFTVYLFVQNLTIGTRTLTSKHMYSNSVRH